jgi:hypothetical protein
MNDTQDWFTVALKHAVAGNYDQMEVTVMCLTSDERRELARACEKIQSAVWYSLGRDENAK